MICNICDEEKWYAVLNKAWHREKDVKYLDGICFDCFETVPSHIPVEQIRKFLERKVNGKEEVGSV